jgi:hypothetical protein
MKSERRGFPILLRHRDKLLAATINKKPKTKNFGLLERKTRLELATTSLEGWSSTN